MSAGYAVDLAGTATGDPSILGGKGANLVRLIRAGIPVPAGFCLTTCAYDAFLDGGVRSVLAESALVPADGLEGMEAVSGLVKQEFFSRGLPAAVDADLLVAYARLGGGPVAVRSSATAEDQPGLSFAGLYDTFLNVVGPDALRQAVLACWASLWTARAIGYRTRNGVAHSGFSMAVVVQQMVAGKASGVAFTANPVTGCRDEVVVDATWGLGEALVSGRVEPDHFVVRGGQVVSRRMGAKAVVVEAVEGGGTRTIAASEAATRAALDDATLLALLGTARRVEDLDGVPQDIEWVMADGALWVVQSRPITALYPVPADARPGEVFYSFAHWQGMLDPFTPLGLDVFAAAVEGVRRSLGADSRRPQRALRQAGGTPVGQRDRLAGDGGRPHRVVHVPAQRRPCLRGDPSPRHRRAQHQAATDEPQSGGDRAPSGHSRRGHGRRERRRPRRGPRPVRAADGRPRRRPPPATGPRAGSRGASERARGDDRGGALPHPGGAGGLRTGPPCRSS